MTAPGADRIEVVLVDDHALVREGVKEILSIEADIVVVGEAADSEQAVAEVARHRPDIALLDIEIPGGDAASTVARMRQLSPRTRIIVLSMYDSPQLLQQLIGEGIRGYLLKSVGRGELISAIRSVNRTSDRMVLSVSNKTMAQLHGGSEQTLSRKEAAVLTLVAQALSNSQIATRMQVTEATVKRHLHNVFGKLGAVSRIDAVNRALAAGLITAPREAAEEPRPPRGGPAGD